MTKFNLFLIGVFLGMMAAILAAQAETAPKFKIGDCLATYDEFGDQTGYTIQVTNFNSLHYKLKAVNSDYTEIMQINYVDLAYKPVECPGAKKHKVRRGPQCRGKKCAVP